MFHKIKWHYISDKARSVVFEYLKLFNERRAQGVKDNNVLERLFNAYNQYVTHKFNPSHMSCGSCVGQVKNFFENEYLKWQKKES
jgi:hypothetical protein